MSRAAPSTILWDWNGTLFDDAWLCHDVMNWTLARRDMSPLSFERYLELFTFPVIEYYRRVGFDFERESFEEVGAEFIAEYERRRHEAKLRPDATDALDALRARGVRQCILSAYHHETLEELTRHFGIRNTFEIVAGHNDIYASGKIAQGRWLVDQLDAAPDTMALVGDTLHDADVARELGCRCVLVEGGNQPPHKLRRADVPVVPDLGAALDTLGIASSQSSPGV